MPTIFKNSAADQTIRIFDGFYNVDVVVNANEYELVQAFFTSVCETKQQAEQFTAFLFRVATESGIPATELLSEMESMRTNSVMLNKFLIFYLNKFRPKTNLYGLSDIPAPVLPAARNVVR
jgi:hypothetical protein